MTLDEFFTGFLKRSKREWRDIVGSWLNQVRTWIGDSPEVAFLASFLLGLTVALGFKFFFYLGLVLGGVAAVVYYFAPSGE